MEKMRRCTDGIGMPLQRLPAFAFVAWLLTACATTDPIEVSGDATALPAFATFRIHEEQYAFATEISAEQRAKVSGELRTAAVNAFEERGYKEADDADVLVTLAAISRPTLDAQAEPAGGLRHVDTSVLDPGQPTMPQHEVVPSGVGREGDLMLYLLDPKTGRALWNARSNGAATTPAEALRKARATYAAMVAKLPRASGGTAHE